jgi:hypothetical protein
MTSSRCFKQDVEVKWMPVSENHMTDDEWRLVRFFRCLSPQERSQLLIEAGSRAIERWLPERTLYDLMPAAAGIEPEGAEYIDQTNAISYVIYSGIEETGDPSSCLLGNSDWDEEEGLPRFVAGADKAAARTGEFL